jgi:hypothetical protein
VISFLRPSKNFSSRDTIPFFLQNSEAAEPEETGKPQGKVVESKPREKGK